MTARSGLWKMCAKWSLTGRLCPKVVKLLAIDIVTRSIVVLVMMSSLGEMVVTPIFLNAVMATILLMTMVIRIRMF